MFENRIKKVFLLNLATFFFKKTSGNISTRSIIRFLHFNFWSWKKKCVKWCVNVMFGKKKKILFSSLEKHSRFIFLFEFQFSKENKNKLCMTCKSILMAAALWSGYFQQKISIFKEKKLLKCFGIQYTSQRRSVRKMMKVLCKWCLMEIWVFI